jgi:hypothetical protein
MSKKSKLSLILSVIVLVLVGVGLFGANKDRISKYFNDRKAQTIYNEMLAEKNALEEKKKNDFAGGKTPEETTEMYLNALKKGDIYLAKSFYEVEVQPEVLKEADKVSTIIKNVELMISQGVKKCFVGLYKEDICSWSIEKSDGLVMDFGLSKNINNVWKIIR